jgi:uncharacterized RDD family membrane protein YckC
MTEQTFAAPEAAAHTTTNARAGFWVRFGASFVDGIIVGIPTVILVAALKGAGYAIALIIAIAYFTYFEGGDTGQTIGKRAFNIRVVDKSGSGSIGHTRAFLRYIGRIVSSIPIYLGYFWMLWDGDKQTWHDKIANSVVVPTNS